MLYFNQLWLIKCSFFLTKSTRTGADLVTCGIWTFSGTCPVLKKLLLLSIYWTLSFSLNFSNLRDLHRGSRTWAGEAKKVTDYLFCLVFLLLCTHTNHIKMISEVTVCSIWLRFHQFTLCHSVLICDNCWLCISQRWCPTKPDHCSALSPRSWGSDASTERGTHPWTVSRWI